ncbi:GNAT family N-acetyltransferase [Vibrio parahaemolyticus]|uniref:GNAT family N-acetyltransferase n=1 Tax=Vibrio parahaemolyticus TaxID=670 RepID=UPI0015B4CB8B|nr:GNAT family N-acetyltransferase [Vibrio parahaemolyticus]EJG0781649.1 GNAT family N-acetyltransferase [Vibrio parahaemolyticus]ELB2110432.1 GNAT family N-acetyltransferase [Vibrio parahaemolyticus]
MINEVSSFEEVKNKTIRHRVKRASTGRSLEYVANLDGYEVGLLSLELGRHPSDQGFIYEVYLLPEFRSKGVGEKLMIHAESQARTLGCKSVRLEARAFDNTIETQWLISWYRKQGFEMIAGSTEYMEKSLA